MKMKRGFTDKHLYLLYFNGEICCPMYNSFKLYKSQEKNNSNTSSFNSDIFFRRQNCYKNSKNKPYFKL